MQFENIGLWKFCFDYVGQKPRYERFENIVQDKHKNKKSIKGKSQQSFTTRQSTKSRVIS